MIRERLIRLHVDDVALEFSDEGDITKFQNALGRMASYALRAGVNEGIEHVEMFVNDKREISAAFYEPLDTMHQDNLAPYIELTNRINSLMSNMKESICAAPKDGAYTYRQLR